MYDLEFIRDLTADFETATVCRARWTHHAHLIIATAYLQKHGGVEASLSALKPKILSLNTANGVENTPTQGYHHSVTKFMLIAVQAFCDHYEVETLEGCVEKLIASDLASGKFPLFFYSHGLLADPNCRLNWVEPDLRPITELDRFFGPKAEY